MQVSTKDVVERSERAAWIMVSTPDTKVLPHEAVRIAHGVGLDRGNGVWEYSQLLLYRRIEK